MPAVAKRGPFSVKKKLLIIPSWYPTEAQRLPGCFFREQALLVQEEYDIYVLYGVKRETSLSGLFKRNGKLDAILTPPAGEAFSFASLKKGKFHRMLPVLEKAVDKVNLFLFRKAFEARFKKLADGGFRPDLIHAHCTSWGGIAADHLGRKFGIPAAITEHQVFLLNLLEKREQAQLKRALSRAEGVLAVSEHQKRSILMNDIRCRPQVVGNLIDEELFRLPQGKRQGVFRILYVSYEGWLKDNDTFFRAIRSLVDRGVQDLEVDVVGGDWRGSVDVRDNPLYKVAASYQVAEYCRFAGNVSRDEMVAHYHEADVFISTSVAETFGVSACEALCCGLPVVATRNGGMDDFLTEENSIRVPIQDFEAVADAVVSIKTGAKGFDPVRQRASIVSRFGRDAFKNRLTKIYEGLMGGAPS